VVNKTEHLSGIIQNDGPADLTNVPALAKKPGTVMAASRPNESCNDCRNSAAAADVGRAINRRLIAIGVSPRTYTCHGLRKTAACELADRGADVFAIMNVLGHKTAKQALEYIREATKEIQIDRAFDIWEAAAA
jgi:integrase